MRQLRTMAPLCGMLLLAAAAGADEITVSGNPYKNVLVTKTESFYYVQIPDEGRTLSLPIAQIDASTVKINKDPFYRDPLKEKYAQNKARRAAGEIKDVDPAFRAASGGDGGGLKLDDVRGGGGGGGGGAAGGGFGIPRTQVETTLGNFGFKFQPGPTSAVSSRPGGGSLELVGPPENLTGIVVKGSGPAQAVDSGAQQLSLLLLQLKPELSAAYINALNEAKQKGSASGSAGGASVSVNRKVNGDTVDLEIRITAG